MWKGKNGRSTALAMMAVTLALLIDMHEAARSPARDALKHAPPRREAAEPEGSYGRRPADRGQLIFSSVNRIFSLFAPHEDVQHTGVRTTDSTADPLAPSYLGEEFVDDASKPPVQTEISTPDPLPLSFPDEGYLEGAGESQVQTEISTPDPLPLSLPDEVSVGDPSNSPVQTAISTPDPSPLSLPGKGLIGTMGGHIDEFTCTVSCGLGGLRSAFFKFCVDGIGDKYCCSSLSEAEGNRFASCSCSSHLCDQWDAFGVRGWFQYCGITGC